MPKTTTTGVDDGAVVVAVTVAVVSWLWHSMNAANTDKSLYIKSKMREVHEKTTNARDTQTHKHTQPKIMMTTVVRAYNTDTQTHGIYLKPIWCLALFLVSVEEICIN